MLIREVVIAVAQLIKVAWLVNRRCVRVILKVLKNGHLR